MSSTRSEAEQQQHTLSTPIRSTTSPDRLWTPWRMPYVAGGARESGCIFCNRLAEADDVGALILWRGERAFVIMNLFPYNTGHAMIVPYAHVASPEDVDAETLTEMSALRAPVLRAMRRALVPEGFNLGLNIGDVAGAGVSDHLHEHVVPRWRGDANFMPILASTMVMPELIPVTYAKLRAELEREARPECTAIDVVLSSDRKHVLVDESGKLPRFCTDDADSVWRSALRAAQQRGALDVELVGWAGASRAGNGPIALLQRTTFAGGGSPGSKPLLSDVTTMLTGQDAEIMQSALEQADKE